MESDARRDSGAAGMGKVGALPKVFIVVLNYKGWRDSIACLESTCRGGYSQFEVVLVDNGSGDESLERIRNWAQTHRILLKAEFDLHGLRPKAFPLSRFEARALTLIETGKNLGFSAGNNRGIEYALANGAEFVLLLNNDTVMGEQTLELLVRAIQSEATAGAVFPLVLGVEGEIQVPVYLRPPRSLWEILLAGNLPGVFLPRYRYRRYLERKNPYPDYRYDRMIALPNIAIAGGALFRRELFEEAGLLDENVFMYHEEAILMQRLRQTRWAVCMEPRARLVHKGGADNSRLPSAFLFAKQVAAEIYYARNYLKLPWWQRTLLKLLRSAQYSYYTFAKSPDYWACRAEFARDYLWR